MVSCSQCGQSFGPGDSGYSACKDHRAAPTRTQIASMQALPAEIKRANDAYTQGRLTYQENSDAYTHILRDPSGRRIVASAPQSSLPHHEANLRRLAACWNACAGIPTAALELCGTCIPSTTSPEGEPHAEHQ